MVRVSLQKPNLQSSKLNHRKKRNHRHPHHQPKKKTCGPCSRIHFIIHVLTTRVYPLISGVKGASSQCACEEEAGVFKVFSRFLRNGFFYHDEEAMI